MKRNHLKRVISKYIFTLLAIFLTSAIFAQTKTCYFIGNSVSDGINLIGVKEMASLSGKTLNFGRNIIPGAPLDWLFDHPTDGFSEEPYGLYPNALFNYDFDAVSFQPFDRREDEDLPSIQKFIALAGNRKTNCQYYIYGRWPRMPNNLDSPENSLLTADLWSNIWQATYTGPGFWDGTEESRGYFEKLTRSVRSNISGIKKTYIVPVGEVMYQLNLKMKAGKVEGYNKIWNVYEDGIHLTTAGSLIPATTYYAVIYGADPRGIALPSLFGTLSSAYITAVQQTVWEVLNDYKDTDGTTWSGISAENIAVSSVSFSSTTSTIVAGNSVTVIATIIPLNASNKTIIYKSSNSEIAIVNSAGVVTGVAAGNTTITATTADGSKLATATIIVTPNAGNVAVTGVSIPLSIGLVNPGTTLQLTGTIAPVNATNKTINWSSSNTALATVSTSGLVTGLVAGSVIITASTADGGKKATTTLKVNAAPTAVISSSTLTGPAPLTVNLGSTGSSDPDAGDYILGYTWDFGDGSAVSNSNAPSHTFASAGTFTVSLKVTDNNNLYSSIVTKSITVTGTPNTDFGNLIDPNATPKTIALWNFLKAQYGNKMLSAGWAENNTAEMVECSGKYPAIFGQDMTSWVDERGTQWQNNWTDAINELKTAQLRGQILTVNWHWGMVSSKINGAYTADAWGTPSVGDGPKLRMTIQQWNDIVTPGTNLYNAMIEDLDYHINGFLKKLVDANGVPIPILFRPLHEIDGGWFWWTNGNDPSKTAQLFKIFKERVTNYHNMHNLIWIFNSAVLNTNGSWPPYDASEYPARQAFYPGDNYCDLIGIDLYDFDPVNRSSYVNSGKTFRDAWNVMKGISPNKMIALCESESLPDVEKAFNDPTHAPWLYALPWFGKSYYDGTTETTVNSCTFNSTQMANSRMINATTVLPINLSLFEAKASGNKAVIKWVTATETQNSRFEILKSTDGVSFSLLKIEVSKGNGATYMIYDTEPVNGINYYRLMQYDLSGKQSNLGTKHVSFNMDNQEVSVYPNPSLGELNIKLPKLDDKELKVEIYNLSGKLIYQKVVQINNRNSLYKLKLINKPETGNYLLKLSGTSLNKSFVITFH